MAQIQSPYNLPGGPVADAIVQNPAANQVGDLSAAVLAAGRQGEQLVSPIHGKFGVMSHRNAGFAASVGTAATAIPVNTTTSGATFALINPASNSKWAELTGFKLDFLHTNAAPATANVIGWSLVNMASNASSAITYLADAVGGSGSGGHSVNMATGVFPTVKVASAVTFASALTVAANWERGMFSFPASWVPTVGGYPVPLYYNFDLFPLMLPPNFALVLTASTAWGSNTVVPHLTWTEFLP